MSELAIQLRDKIDYLAKHIDSSTPERELYDRAYIAGIEFVLRNYVK